jgi:hypothetical protein
MPDYPAEWRRALELLATSPEGATGALLMAQGFAATTITGLVDTGLATQTIDYVLAARHRYELMTRFKITDVGRVALER